MFPGRDVTGAVSSLLSGAIWQEKRLFCETCTLFRRKTSARLFDLLEVRIEMENFWMYQVDHRHGDEVRSFIVLVLKRDPTYQGRNIVLSCVPLDFTCMSHLFYDSDVASSETRVLLWSQLCIYAEMSKSVVLKNLFFFFSVEISWLFLTCLLNLLPTPVIWIPLTTFGAFMKYKMHALLFQFTLLICFQMLFFYSFFYFCHSFFISIHLSMSPNVCIHSYM